MNPMPRNALDIPCLTDEYEMVRETRMARATNEHFVKPALEAVKHGRSCRNAPMAYRRRCDSATGHLHPGALSPWARTSPIPRSGGFPTADPPSFLVAA
jgi:hypothetical protein